MTLVHFFGVLLARLGLALTGLCATAVASASSWRAWVVAAYLGLTLFLLDANPNAFFDAGINLSRPLMLLIGVGALVIGLVQLPKTYRLLITSPAIFLFIYVLFALFSTIYSATPRLTLEVGFVLVGLMLFSAAVARVLTLKTVLITVAMSLGLFVILSWAVYFALPELGVNPSGRMAGLTAHANILGRSVTLFLGALFLLFGYRYCSLQCVVAPAVLGLAALATSDSRTSMLAFSAAIVIFASRRWPWLLLPLCLVIVSSFFYFTLSPVGVRTEILEGLSRRGHAEEIVTLTGRTTIWAAVFDVVRASPWLGYGYGASRLILSEDWSGVASNPPHAHNMILQSLLSVGVIGTLFLFLVVLWQTEALVRRPAAFRDSLFIFVIMMGLTEAAALRPEPNTLILLWFVSLFWEGDGTDGRS